MFREKYGLRPGSEVRVVDYDGELTLVPAFKDPINDDSGLLNGADSLTQAMIEEHRRERERG